MKSLPLSPGTRRRQTVSIFFKMLLMRFTNCNSFFTTQVVAYHFCQSENNTTCYVPEFLHSIAAQFCQVPQLTAYRDLLVREPHLQNLLSIRNCIQNPSLALTKGIIEPLVMLRQSECK